MYDGVNSVVQRSREVLRMCVCGEGYCSVFLYIKMTFSMSFYHYVVFMKISFRVHGLQEI